MKQTLNEYLAAREALFRNPSDERARAWWTSEGYAPPMHPTVPLATVHKARLQWLDATDDMLGREPRVPVRLRLPGCSQHPRVTRQRPGTPRGRNSALPRSRTTNELPAHRFHHGRVHPRLAQGLASAGERSPSSLATDNAQGIN